MDIWDGDHLSELALSCIADAQDVIDPVARVHAESCAACAMRIGQMALESHDVGAALRVAQEMSVAQAKPKHAFPTVLVASAAIVALACGTPAMIEGFPHLVAWVFAAPRIAPAVTSSLVSLANVLSASPGGAAVSLVSTFTLALFGFAVARASSKHGVSQ